MDFRSIIPFKYLSQSIKVILIEIVTTTYNSSLIIVLRASFQLINIKFLTNILSHPVVDIHCLMSHSAKNYYLFLIIFPKTFG